MAKAPDRTYPDEASQRRSERLRQRRRAADRIAAPMFCRNVAEAELAAQGLIDLQAGEYLMDISINDDNLVATIAKPTLDDLERMEQVIDERPEVQRLRAPQIINESGVDLAASDGEIRAGARSAQTLVWEWADGWRMEARQRGGPALLEVIPPYRVQSFRATVRVAASEFPVTDQDPTFKVDDVAPLLAGAVEFDLHEYTLNPER